MKRDNEMGQFDGFLINNVIYLVAMYIASFFPFVARTLLSFMLKTPSAAELKADGSYLFDVIYPIVGFLTLAAFIAGGWYCSYYAAFKVAYRTNKYTDTFKMKLQMVFPSLAVFALNLYMGFVDKFSGMLGIQFWYPAAITSSLAGTFDKTDLLGALSNADFVTTHFILDGLACKFPWLTVMYALIYSVGFSVACYYGRKTGMNRGIKNKDAYLDTVRNANKRV